MYILTSTSTSASTPERLQDVVRVMLQGRWLLFDPTALSGAPPGCSSGTGIPGRVVEVEDYWWFSELLESFPQKKKSIWNLKILYKMLVSFYWHLIGWSKFRFYEPCRFWWAMLKTQFYCQYSADAQWSSFLVSRFGVTWDCVLKYEAKGKCLSRKVHVWTDKCNLR